MIQEHITPHLNIVIEFHDQWLSCFFIYILYCLKAAFITSLCFVTTYTFFGASLDMPIMELYQMVRERHRQLIIILLLLLLLLSLWRASMLLEHHHQ